MDDFALHQELQDIDDESEDDDEILQMQAASAIIILGAEEARERRIEQRRHKRLYLRRQELSSPQETSAWQRLRENANDRAFITTMGFDVSTFKYILESGFMNRWVNSTIPREDTCDAGVARPARRSLDAYGALALILHYLNSTMREVSLQEIFGLIPTTVSRYINFAMKILLETLQKDIKEASIQWPLVEEFEELNDIILSRHDLLIGAFGTVDGLNLPVQTAEDVEIENATYNGWLHSHFVSSVLVFSPKGTIIAAALNAPGSWHDSRVAASIYNKLLNDTPEGYYLVADTAFPRGTDYIEGRIKAPHKVGQRLRGTQIEIHEQMRFNRQILSYRQSAEWGMRTLQGSFGRLRIPLEIHHTKRRADLLEVCVRLNNLRATRVGINQIRTVYLENWKRSTENQQVWDAFEYMLFGDQQKFDRVSNFHTSIQYT